MRAEVLLALNRNVANGCSTGRLSLQRLLSGMAQEILLMVAPEITGVAVIATAIEGRPLVGQARDGVCLSEEALAWLSESCGAAARSLVVKDHTLEPLSYSASAPRSSVVVRLNARLCCLTHHGVQLWFGSDLTVTPRLVEKLQRVSAAVSEWLDSSAQTIAMVLEASSATRELESYRQEVLSSAHDIRAALGALRYRRSIEEPGAGCDGGSIADLNYIQSLLARLGASEQIRGELQEAACCRISEVVQRVVERWRASAEQSGIKVHVASRAWDARASIESVELERALTNIIGNAVRHSKGSDIAIEIQRVGDELALVVRDNGRGFPKEVLSSLRGGATRLRSSGDGWGVGLVSTRDRIKAAGGAMLVSSSIEGGGVVTLTLPIPSYATDDRTTAPELRELSSYGSDADQCREVVLIDDDEEYTASLGRVLSRYGISTRSFSSLNGVAEELARSDISSIICDINMPEGGAEELLAQVRSSSCSSAIAIMSGESDDARLYRLAAAGAQAFFCKPVEIEALVEWVRSRSIPK